MAKLRRFPFYHQLEAMDCGATCLRMIARYYGRFYSLEYLRELTYLGKQGVSLLEISDAAEALGMQTLAVKTSFDRLSEDIPLPCVAHWEDDHFVVLYRASSQHVWVADSEAGKFKLDREDFLRGWAQDEEDGEPLGVLLLLEPTDEFYEHEGREASKASWSYVFSYFRRYRYLIIQLLAGLFVGGLLQMAFPFLLKGLVDVGIGHVEPKFITMMVMGLLFIFLTQVGVELLRRWVLLHMGVRVNIKLVSDFLAKLTRLPLRFFDSRMTGDLMQRITDHERVQYFLTSTALFSALSLFNFVAFSFLLLFWSGWVFAMFFIGTLFQLAWVYFFQYRKRELEYKRFDQSAENQGKLIELINGMQELKLHNAEAQKRWSWERTQSRLIRTGIDSLVIDQWQRSGADVLNELKNLLITFFVANAVLTGEMTLGMLVAILYVIGQLNAPIRQFVEFMRALQEAHFSLERMNEIHEKADEEDISQKITMLPEMGDLILDRVSFQYDGPNSPTVIRQVSLRVPKGKMTAIVGSSGSGKTTLLKLMLGIYPPTEGAVRLGDVNLDNIQQRLWRDKVGAVLQDGYIFNDTIARNIALGDEIIDKHKLLRAVKVANVQSFIESLPLGYSTRIGQEGLGLSQGERQRLLIARAVYKNPEYLFLDEATTALDTYNEMLITEELREAFAGRTVVAVAHRLNTIREADYIIVLEGGEVVEQGSHDQLYFARGAYHHLLRNQMELGA
ncbi:MAG: peptidase domain-containing ABC transporter [Lewinella sp.]|nr:peptidase domain-containing ABC transporter [Lewinella sp.]